MKFAYLAIGLISWSSFALPAFARDPRGESARFALDRDRARTISMIKDGTIVTTVTQNAREDNGVTQYDVRLDYAFKVAILGNKTGSKILPIPVEYWSEGFMEKLRQDINYEAPHFKLRHEGRRDARTMNGTVYPASDVLFLYDMDLPDANPLSGLTLAMVQQALPHVDWSQHSLADIENLTVRVHVYPGIPALGVVKIDVAGRMSGNNFKAGGDYVPAP